MSNPLHQMIIDQIDKFDRETQEIEHTDTGRVWDILRGIKETLSIRTHRLIDPETLSGTFDWALPQSWYDDVYKMSGFNPATHFVWWYPEDSLMGFAVPITKGGIEIMNKMINMVPYSE